MHLKTCHNTTRKQPDQL